MKNNLNVRFWIVDDENNFQFPETNPLDELYYKPIENRPVSGICISGGGTVSASLIAGYFKALDELDLMNSLRYISGVSGGCWGSAPFAYMQNLDDSSFYAAVKAPGEYYLDKNKAKDGDTDVNICPPNSMTYAVCNADIFDLTIKATDHKHEAYARAVGTIFLHPFNIPSPDSDFETRRYFTSDADAVTDIASRNQQLDQSELDKILKLAANRPYLIMNTTFLYATSDHDYLRFLFEITPNYAGMYAKHDIISNIQIGGSYIESIGFNTTPTGIQGDTINTEADYKFELCEPVGTSGSAVEEMILKKGGLEHELDEWLPQYNYWNPTQYQQDPSNIQMNQFFFGDGGIIENTGVIALLLRQIKNVAMFLSEPVYFEDNYPKNETIEFNIYEIFGYNQIACLFGEQLLKVEKEATGKNQTLEVLTKVDDEINRQVFENNNGEFQALLDALHTARTNGEPMVCKQSLTVIDNALFGIKGGWISNVIWSVIDTCSTFNAQLDADISSQIGAPGALEDFPKVKVFNQDAGHLIQLEPIQANLLGSLAYWMVTTESDTYKSTLTKLNG